ncbi:hypothetical protein AB1Y20_004199 [Prymnesium parvum]|uniref:Fe2OG dioxygenase domain-containing protein n=1 Tax=Prymnesium parvum TaxID=97485 RepID=A0AB34J622_PRYPA
MEEHALLGAPPSARGCLDLTAEALLWLQRAVRDASCYACCFEAEGVYHEINEEFGGVEYLHRQPDVIAVHGFLSDEECDRLREKAEGKLKPCGTYDSDGRRQPRNSNRTSSEALVTQREVPTIIAKLTALLRCTPEQLQTLNVVRYTAGQQFKPHCDASSGRCSRIEHGFVRSTRLVSVLVYLNSPRRGGKTIFPWFNMSIQPCKGTALLHFPASLSYHHDPRTLHSGAPAIEDKWILVTWMWYHPRDPSLMDEANVPELSSSRI